MKSILSLILILSSFTVFAKTYDLDEAKVFKFLTIAGQPSKRTIDSVKEQNFDIVINLRSPKEFDEFDEKSYVESKGLEYVNIPFFDKNKKIGQKNIDRITSFVEKHKKKKIFIHCSSGNRVAAWLLIHLNKDHNMSVDKALKVSKEMGLNKTEMEVKVLDFIKSTN